MAARNGFSARFPARMVLTGVPKVGFYQGGQRCPEDVPFPSCLRACLDYMGGAMGYRLISEQESTWRLDNTFTFLMGVSGCAFRHNWKPGWEGDNVEIMYMSDDPAAPFLRAAQAAGWSCELVDPEGRHDDEGLYRRAILHSLRDCSRPVIAFGVIGPPEACLVTGYDEGGDILIGWNFFQEFPEYQDGTTYEPTGEFRKRGWFPSTLGLLVLGNSRPGPSWAESCRKALRWALRVMRTPVTFGERANGIAAYQAWADHLLMDADFPIGDLETLRQRFMVHDDAVGMVAEGRWYAAKFMELAAAMTAEAYPAMEEDLLAAAACFEAEHDLMWRIWGLVGGNGRSDDHVQRLADSRVRRAIAPIILQSRDKDIEAAQWIERALRCPSGAGLRMTRFGL